MCGGGVVSISWTGFSFGKGAPARMDTSFREVSRGISSPFWGPPIRITAFSMVHLGVWAVGKTVSAGLLGSILRARKTSEARSPLRWNTAFCFRARENATSPVSPLRGSKRICSLKAAGEELRGGRIGILPQKCPESSKHPHLFPLPLPHPAFAFTSPRSSGAAARFSPKPQPRLQMAQNAVRAPASFPLAAFGFNFLWPRLLETQETITRD